MTLTDPTYKEKLAQIQSELRAAEQNTINALNHIRDMMELVAANLTKL